MTDQPDISDDDITRDPPTEQDDDKDQGGAQEADTGDEPTEADENLDAGHGEQDSGDE